MRGVEGDVERGACVLADDAEPEAAIGRDGAGGVEVVPVGEVGVGGGLCEFAGESEEGGRGGDQAGEGGVAVGLAPLEAVGEDGGGEELRGEVGAGCGEVGSGEEAGEDVGGDGEGA